MTRHTTSGGGWTGRQRWLCLALAVAVGLLSQGCSRVWRESRALSLLHIVHDQAADLALRSRAKGLDPAVQILSGRIAYDHAVELWNEATIAKKAGIIAIQSGAGRRMVREYPASIARLAGLEGAPFDAAFLDAVITFHEQAIAALDLPLKPGDTEELKQIIERTKGLLTVHLLAARAVRSGPVP
ncbi:DUF4142 domain-containing protein [Candidatus Nitrospira bockiana]